MINLECFNTSPIGRYTLLFVLFGFAAGSTFGAEEYGLTVMMLLLTTVLYWSEKENTVLIDLSTPVKDPHMKSTQNNTTGET